MSEQEYYELYARYSDGIRFGFNIDYYQPEESIFDNITVENEIADDMVLVEIEKNILSYNNDNVTKYVFAVIEFGDMF